jgi:hypothetical protein
MSKVFILLLMLLMPSIAYGVELWEYRVVYLQGIMNDYKSIKQPDGSYVDQFKTDVLNKLAVQGWDVIAVTGAVGADHAVYLRRRK